MWWLISGDAKDHCLSWLCDGLLFDEVMSNWWICGGLLLEIWRAGLLPEMVRLTAGGGVAPS